MSIVSFRGKALIPAPQVGFRRIIQRTPEGTARQHGFQVKITGVIVLWKGSPDENGAFWTNTGYPPDTAPEDATEPDILDIFKKKIGAVQQLFDTDGLLLIQPVNGGAPIKAQLTINSVDIPEGKWTRVVPYSIDAEAQYVVWGTESGDDPGSQSQIKNPPEESWSIEQQDEFGRAFKLTHTLSSSAKKRFDDDGNVTAEGWEVAQDLILGGPLAGTGAVSKLGFDSQFLIATGVLNLDNFQPYNYVRSQQTDKGNGRVSISESWTCIDPTVESPTGQTTGVALEELSVDSRYNIDDGLYSVAVNGVINGLEARDPVTRDMITDRWANAIARYNTITPSVIFGVAESISGYTLNPTALSVTVAKNRVSGVIQYSYSYNNRIGNSDPSYISESIEIEFNNAADVFSEIGVISRPTGPILQDIGSTTRKSATINIGIMVNTSYGNTPTMPITNPLAIFTSFIGIPTQVFLASDVPRWNYKQGRYSRSTTYVYQ